MLEYSLSSNEWEGVLLAANTELQSEGVVLSQAKADMLQAAYPLAAGQVPNSTMSSQLTVARQRVQQAMETSRSDQNVPEPTITKSQNAIGNTYSSRYSALLLRSDATTNEFLGGPPSEQASRAPTQAEMNLTSMKQRAAGGLEEAAMKMSLLRSAPDAASTQVQNSQASFPQQMVQMAAQDDERRNVMQRFESRIQCLEGELHSQVDDTRALVRRVTESPQFKPPWDSSPAKSPQRKVTPPRSDQFSSSSLLRQPSGSKDQNGHPGELQSSARPEGQLHRQPAVTDSFLSKDLNTMDFTAIDTNDAGIDRTEWASATTPEASAIVAMPPMEFGTDFADYQQAMEKTMQIYEVKIRQLVGEKARLADALSTVQEQHRAEQEAARGRENALQMSLKSVQANCDSVTNKVRLEQLEQRNLFLEQQLAQHHGLNQSALAAQTHLHVPFMRSPPRRDASLIEQQARDLADAYKNNDFLRFQVEKQGRKT